MSFLLPALMLVGLAAALFSGLPVAVVLIGVAFLFAGLGILAGSVRIEEMGAIFHRVYGTLSDRDEVLYAAVPMLLFMGAVLHESRLAADLLAGAARLFGRVRGGPALATLAVAAIQAPAAGMVGASTGALALYALPALRRHGYGTQEAAGLVAAAGTLGVVAPPGIMLFFVAGAIGGQAMISAAAAALGYRGALSLITAMIFVFVLGFFLDWLEIVVIALPALASALVAAGVGAQFGNAQLAACWLGALFAVNLQTSFLTPPFGYALFLVHGATGGAVTIPQVWRGALPYLVLQLVTLIAVAVIPELATWLPAQLLDLSVPKGPKFNE